MNSWTDSPPIRMVVTDLDGTLLGPDRSLSDRDYRTLVQLGDAGILRVIATGRSLYSAASVLADDLPVDVLIFSSGAGILDWSTRQILAARHLPAATVRMIAETLLAARLDFMIQEPIPDNHRFVFARSGRPNPDFERRIALYRDFARPVDADPKELGHACQIIVIVPDDVRVFEQLKKDLRDANVIRTTSPLDGRSIWIEIFPADVSKGHAAQWLCDRRGIDPSRTLGIGNDYNDLDLLAWAGHSRVLANAPADLKARFPVAKSHHSSGFTHAVMQHVDLAPKRMM